MGKPGRGIESVEHKLVESQEQYGPDEAWSKEIERTEVLVG